jgi:predicted MFS family arabinose efflux permease
VQPYLQALRGRLNVYRATSAVGVAASALAAVACDTRSFTALCIASLMFGLPAAAGQSFRFAALSLVPPNARPQTIGMVLSGWGAVHVESR